MSFDSYQWIMVGAQTACASASEDFLSFPNLKWRKWYVWGYLMQRLSA